MAYNFLILFLPSYFPLGTQSQLQSCTRKTWYPAASHDTWHTYGQLLKSALNIKSTKKKKVSASRAIGAALARVVGISCNCVPLVAFCPWQVSRGSPVRCVQWPAAANGGPGSARGYLRVPTSNRGAKSSSTGMCNQRPWHSIA